MHACMYIMYICAYVYLHVPAWRPQVLTVLATSCLAVRGCVAHVFVTTRGCSLRVASYETKLYCSTFGADSFNMKHILYATTTTTTAL